MQVPRPCAPRDSVTQNGVFKHHPTALPSFFEMMRTVLGMQNLIDSSRKCFYLSRSMHLIVAVVQLQAEKEWSKTSLLELYMFQSV